MAPYLNVPHEKQIWAPELKTSAGNANRLSTPVDTPQSTRELYFGQSFWIPASCPLWKESCSQEGQEHVWEDALQGNGADWCGAMARASDPGKPSRQPAVLGTEGACSCQGLCCHLSAGQAPDHSHESLQVAALAGAGCLPSLPLLPLSRAPSPLPPSASAPDKTWRHISHLPKSSSWTGWGRKWNRVSTKVTWKVQDFLSTLSTCELMHLYQEWRKHRSLPPCLTHSQEGWSLEMRHRLKHCLREMFQRLQVLCLRGLSLALSCSFPSYNPPLSPVHLDTSLVCHWEFSLQKPQQNCTATKENFPFSLGSGSWYNSGQGRSYRKFFPTLLKAFLFCMRTGRPVQQASQIGHAISVLRGFQDLNDQALSDLLWSQLWSCFKQQTQLETYNLNYSMSFCNRKNR